jgi:DNA-binding NarL/FixJ family response regulator
VTAGVWTRRILLVEDEPLLASLMGQVLVDSGFIVEVCTSESAARSTLRTFDPDAALIDVHLGNGPFGLTLAHVLARTHPHVGVLLLSRFEDLSAAGLDHGTMPSNSRFLPKDRLTDRRALIEAIDTVLRGGIELPGSSDGAGPLSTLTRTQLGVLHLAALGLTNAAIARRRGTSAKNVEQRLRSVYDALGIPADGDVNPRVEAVRRYVAAAGLPVGPTQGPPADRRMSPTA